MADSDDPFRAYHRARWRMTLRRRGAFAAASAALVAGLSFWVAAAPPAVSTVAVESTPAQVAPLVEAPGVAPAALVDAPAALPEPAPSAAPEPAPRQLPITGPHTWSIAIDTTGYQAEIDRCLWVRMDLGTPAPIVGAHNYCGGGVVLEMLVGDTVTLSGTGLDGTYTVAGERNARAGDDAFGATSGFDADVILQTCYWSNDGSERLIALVLG